MGVELEFEAVKSREGQDPGFRYPIRECKQKRERAQRVREGRAKRVGGGGLADVNIKKYKSIKDNACKCVRV